ncbi:PAS domain S-box protein [candidate division KSB1 bacterium]|nr:PAS domain S-box protein [candidate division KSB1 bacterium]
MKPVKQYFSPPEFPGDDAKTRAAQVLHTLLLYTMVGIFILMIAIPLIFVEKQYNFIAGIIALFILSASYWLMRRGRVYFSSIIFVSIIWVILNFMVIHSGGMRSIITIFYVTATITTGLLLGYRAALYYAIICIFSGLGMVLMERSGFEIPILFPLPSHVAWLDFTISLALTLTALNIALRSQKRALARVRQSQSRFATLFEEAPVMYLIVHHQGDVPMIDNCNAAFISKLGYTKQQVLGKPLADFYDQKSKTLILNKNEMEKIVHEPIRTPMERVLVTKDGRIIHTLLQISPDLDDAGNIKGTLAMYLDISERKKAESQRDEMLKQVLFTLKEKETLLRELYHRTKNNMQVISALLDLQCVYTDDERLQSAFTDTKNRIHSMALVHQKLYEAKDLSHVNLKEYIHDLAELLMSSYDISHGEIILISEMQDVSVLIDTAIPCGLIINELLSNAFKHAFPENRSGVIRVELNKIKNQIQLVVSDNGVGVPVNFNFRENGRLGLQNIISIGEKQLGGKVLFQTNGGVTCRLSFSDNLYKPRV